ncbi:MAG TPA: hypothetical protein VL995_20575 [Cellvibrio sp.]|nr:hypothetical protein [Cellvibrio sp.]
MKRVLTSVGFVLPLVLILSACGGGGGSKKETPASVSPPSSTGNSSVSTSVVTPSSIGGVGSSSAGITSSSTQISSSDPATVSLSIEGKVAAEALAAGTVVFTVGSQTFSAPINDSLQYNVTLNVPLADAATPFAAIASGSGSDKWVELAALFPSLQTLREKAGSDNRLDATEFFGVNITTITTAEYAEINNRNLPLATDVERASAMMSVSTTRVLEQAGMLWMLLTDIDATLPAPAKSTLDYLLNANLAETHLEVVRFEGGDWLLNDYTQYVLTDSAQVNVSAKKIMGSYALESSAYQYFLTFNEDGTGTLVARTMHVDIRMQGQSSTVAAAFNWVRKSKSIKLEFDEPIQLSAMSFRGSNQQFISCEDSTVDGQEYCNLSIDTIQLDLVTESDLRYIANLHVFVEVTRSTDGYLLYEEILPPQSVRLVSTNNFVAANAEDFIGTEWVSNAHSYLFTDDKKVTQTNLLTQEAKELDWMVDGNRLRLTDVDLWLTHKEPVGFGVIYATSNSAHRISLVKRTAVVMSEDDWQGRWARQPETRASFSYEVNADKTWQAGYETELSGTWSMLDDHRQRRIALAGWQEVRDVLAIQGTNYYMVICGGTSTSGSTPTSCQLITESRAKDFDSNIFFRTTPYVGFSEKATGAYWMFFGTRLIYSDPESSELLGKEYGKIAANKFYEKYTGTVTEIFAVNKQEIDVCLYQLGEQCDETKKQRLERGVVISTSVGEGGAAYQKLVYKMGVNGFTTTHTRSIAKVLTVPRGYSSVVEIRANTGYSFDGSTVTGCGGTLVGSDYQIPALTADCEITINFNKN